MRYPKWPLAIATVVFLGAVIFALMRGHGAPANPHRLVVGLDSEIERLDPLTIKNPKTFIVSWQIYEGLLGLGVDGKIIPKVADAWTSVDNRIWRFHVRDGVFFHASKLFGGGQRGRQVKADDVVASYTAFCGANAYPAFLLTDILEGCADYNSGKASLVSGVRKINDMTVELKLIKPEPFFLNRLTTPWIAIFPKEASDPANRDRWGFDDAVGTGPFRLVSNSASEVKLERNPDYWDKSQKGSVNEISYRVIKNDPARLAAIRSGSIDLMPAPTSLYPSIFEKTGALKSDIRDQLQLIKYATFNSHMIGFNVLKMPDVNLRLAISHGIDRRRIVDALFYTYAKVNGGTVPAGMNGFVSAISTDGLYNPDLAKQELARSGYKGEPIELLVHDQAGSEQIGEMVQAQLKSIGVNITLTKVDFNTAIGRMVKGDVPMFSMYLDYVFSSPELVITNMFASTKRPVPNFWQFSDPAIDGRLEGLRSLNHADAIKASADIEAAVVGQAPAAFLFQLTPVALERRGLEPVQINAHGDFDFASLGRN